MRNMQHWLTELKPIRLFGADGEGDDSDESQEDASSDNSTDETSDKSVEDKYSQEYVEKLRQEAASRRVAANDAKKETDSLKAELAKIKQAEMSDLEAAQSKLEEAQTQLDAAKADSISALANLKTERIQNAVTMAAVEAGFVDPTDALSMISQDDLVDDEGTIVSKTVKARLKALADKKPYLLKKNHLGSGDGGGTGKGSEPDTHDDKVAAYRKQMIETGGRVLA